MESVDGAARTLPSMGRLSWGLPFGRAHGRCGLSPSGRLLLQVGLGSGCGGSYLSFPPPLFPAYVGLVSVLPSPAWHRSRGAAKREIRVFGQRDCERVEPCRLGFLLQAQTEEAVPPCWRERVCVCVCSYFNFFFFFSLEELKFPGNSVSTAQAVGLIQRDPSV